MVAFREVRKFRGRDRALITHAMNVLNRLHEHETGPKSDTLNRFFDPDPSPPTSVVNDLIDPLHSALGTALDATLLR